VFSSEGEFEAKNEKQRITIWKIQAEFLRHREQRAIGDLFGTVDFLPDFDHKKLRANR
jgi:hypothetical protein